MPSSVRPRAATVGRASASRARAAARIGADAAVRRRMVRERVAAEWSSNRSRSTTVRPARPDARMWRVTRLTSPSSTASRASGERGRRPTADWAPKVRCRRARRTGRGSRLWASACRYRPEPGPSRATSSASSRAATSPTRVSPRRCSRAAVAGPTPPQALHRQAVQQRQLALVGDHHQAVGLGQGGGHLGEALGGRDPHGDGQPGVLAHVQEGLVDRQPLDHRRGAGDDVEHGAAGLDVRLPPRGHDQRVGAQPARPRPARSRPDAVRAGLVAGGHHDPRAHDHGPPPQARIVALLHRREERVEVRVQDGRLAWHEHMFAHRPDGRERKAAGDQRPSAGPGSRSTTPNAPTSPRPLSHPPRIAARHRAAPCRRRASSISGRRRTASPCRR